MTVEKYIDTMLESYRDSDRKLSSVPDNFIYAYGPYMCMQPGAYENECDEIARYSKLMNVMVHAAYLIRKITSGISYRDAKKAIKDFNLSIYLTFANSKDDDGVYTVLSSFANNYLSKIRKDQKEKGELESFITCASPIIPYQEIIKRPDQLGTAEEEATRVDIARNLPTETPQIYIEGQLQSLLMTNLPEIMLNYKLCTVLSDIDLKSNLLKLDKLMIRDSSVSIEAQKYYFLATVNYYGIYNTDEYEKYIHFFEEAGDFSKTQSYSAFESMVNTMAKSTNIDIATESWDDPSMDDREESAVSTLIQSQYTIKDNEERSRYDFGILNDYINVKRFMKFEDFPNRLFVGSLEKTKIINVNNMGGDRNYYEMDNDTVACPFLDLRTYQPRVIVLYANTNEIGIIDDIHDLY